MNYKQFIDEKLMINEKYNSSLEYSGNVYPIYKDITSSEIDDVLKEENNFYQGVRFGVANPSVIYGWNIDLLHFRVSKFLHVDFWIKLDYIKHRNYISLSEFSDVELFKNNFGGILAKKFKDILPSKVKTVKDIDENIVWKFE
jgi:hypothetical protein